MAIGTEAMQPNHTVGGRGAGFVLNALKQGVVVHGAVSGSCSVLSA